MLVETQPEARLRQRSSPKHDELPGMVAAIQQWSQYPLYRMSLPSPRCGAGRRLSDWKFWFWPRRGRVPA